MAYSVAKRDDGRTFPDTVVRSRAAAVLCEMFINVRLAGPGRGDTCRGAPSARREAGLTLRNFSATTGTENVIVPKTLPKPSRHGSVRTG